MVAINVADGTRAGWRRVIQPNMWTHVCPIVPDTVKDPVRADTFSVQLTPKTLTSYACPDCGTRRP